MSGGLFCSVRRVSAKAICNSSSHFFQSVSWAVRFEARDADIKCGSTVTPQKSHVDKLTLFL